MHRFAAALTFAAFTLSAETPIETARRLKEHGIPPDAAKASEAALPALRTANDRALLAQATLEAAEASFAAGDYNRSFDRASEAVTLFRRRGDSSGEAAALSTAGSAQLHRGQYPGALELFRAALALDLRGHDAKGEAFRLGSIGNAFFFQGKYLDALENYEAGLRRIDQCAAESWAAGRRQIALTNLAILYEQLGQNQRAVDSYQLVLASGESGSPAERGQVLSNLGDLYCRMGESARAFQSYDAARKLFASEQLSDAGIHVLQSTGVALTLDPADTAGGVRLFGDALKLAESAGNRPEIALAHLFRGEALFRSANLPAAAADFEAALTAARETGAAGEQWTALYGIARAARRQGDSALALTRLREAIAIIESAPSPIASLKSGFLPGKRNVYDAAIGILLQSPQRDNGQLFRLFEQARACNLRETMRGPSVPPSLGAVQQRLPEDSGLIEYWIGDGRLAALWVTRTASGLIDRPWTAENSAAVRSRLASQEASQEFSPDASLLQEVPWDRFRRAIIVPDGGLYRVPFEALRVGPAGPLLIERMPVSYLPSASLLLRDPPPRGSVAPWRVQLAAFGDPVVDPASTLPGDEGWGRLPESGRELHYIAAALPGRAAIYTGTGDLKRRLEAGGLERVPLLHLATHSIVDTMDSNRSRIRFTPEAGSRGSGYLFRSEVQALSLEGVELVTLSGCETETGGATQGEAIQSLSRAFLAAGARSTVTTLWRVEDRATADFMQVFYTNLGKGLTKSEALRAAKLSFLHGGGARAQPQYWAAFVLNGDGDSPIRPVLSWIAVFGVAAFGATAIALYFRRRRAA